MVTPNIRSLLASKEPVQDVTVQGWVRTRRDSKACTFIELNDGSCLRGLQVVADNALSCAELYPRILTGASVRVTGDLVASLVASRPSRCWPRTSSCLVNPMAPMPLQKKATPRSSSAHLPPASPHESPRQRLPRAQPRGLCHPPLLPGAGLLHMSTRPSSPAVTAEGAGEMFRVTTLPARHARQAGVRTSLASPPFSP